MPVRKKASAAVLKTTRARAAVVAKDQGKRQQQEGETREDLIRTLSEFFYPVHYKVGAVFEAALSRGVLTRKQFAVLWIIHSFGDDGVEIPRKRLELELAHSLELETSAVSKVLRELSSPANKLLTVTRSEASAREKLVRLTAKGAQFLDAANQAGIRLLTAKLSGMSEATMRAGVLYLGEVARRFDVSEPSE